MAQLINEAKRMQQLAGVLNENLNEEDKKQKFPEDVWSKLPPPPDQVKWDKILAHMASQYDGGYESKEDLILTIGGIAKGTTSSGAYSGWMNHKKTAQPQAESQLNKEEVKSVDKDQKSESIEQTVNEALKKLRKGK
jgi:hypothetical protein